MNLSVTGILLQMPQPQRIGERLECEIDCFLRQGRKTILHGVGEVVRNGNSRGTLAAIHFDLNGASIRSEVVKSADQVLDDAKLVIVARSVYRHEIGGQTVAVRERMPLGLPVLDHAVNKIRRQHHL